MELDREAADLVFFEGKEGLDGTVIPCEFTDFIFIFICVCVCVCVCLLANSPSLN